MDRSQVCSEDLESDFNTQHRYAKELAMPAWRLRVCGLPYDQADSEWQVKAGYGDSHGPKGWNAASPPFGWLSRRREGLCRAAVQLQVNRGTFSERTQKRHKLLVWLYVRIE